jgi:hypothetical protein
MGNRTWCSSTLSVSKVTMGGFKVPSFLAIIYSFKGHFYDNEYENDRINRSFRVSLFYQIHYLISLNLAQKIT